MSFIITVYTNEGIIMASDSRTTYTTTEMLPNGATRINRGVQTTDSTYKTYLCNDRIGISTCGTASINGVPIAGYIERFIAEKTTDGSSVSDISQGLLDYFSAFTPIPEVHFIVTGYDPNDTKQVIYRVFVESNSIIPTDTSSQGAVWDGEAETLKRVIKAVGIKNPDGTYSDLSVKNIGFNFFTLQDAIDFAQYAVDITIKTMRFQNVVKTVGGPIDILAIKPTGAFWVQRKELHA